LRPFADPADRARYPREEQGKPSAEELAASDYERHALVSLISVLEAYIRRIGIYDAELGHDCFPRSPHFDGVARTYFAGSSLILSPPFATGMTQSGVVASAELRSDV
jgi:hypothetical protein